MGKLKYDVEEFAEAIANAQLFKYESNSVNSSCLSIINNINTPSDLDLSHEKRMLTDILKNMMDRSEEILSSVNQIREQVESMDISVSAQINSYLNNFDFGKYKSDGSTSLWEKIKGVYNDTNAILSDKITDSVININKWLEDNNLTWIRDAYIKYIDVRESVAATSLVAAQSLVEGVLKFGGALVDTGALVLAADSTINTLKFDAVQAVYGLVTGNEWESATKKMWDLTTDFVQTEYVSGWFDKLYDNTKYGQSLKEKSYGFDTARSIGSGVGYIGGIILLTVLTAGTGSVVATAGGTTASGAAAGITIGSSAASVTAPTISLSTSALAAGGYASLAGFGKNTSEALNDGASTTESLAYGATMGLWEGLEMTLGYAIGSLKAFKGTDLISKFLNSLLHVGLDALDGSTQTFANSLLQMIYSPNDENINQIMKNINFDENGNQINNKTWEDLSFSEQYSALFDYNGGWKSVATNATTAGIFSFLSEIPDILKGADFDSVYTKYKEYDENGNLIKTDKAKILNKEDIDLIDLNSDIDDFIDVDYRNVNTNDNYILGSNRTDTIDNTMIKLQSSANDLNLHNNNDIFDLDATANVADSISKDVTIGANEFNNGFDEFDISKVQPKTVYDNGFGEFDISKVQPKTVYDNGFGEFDISKVQPKTVYDNGFDEFDISKVQPKTVYDNGFGEFDISKVQPKTMDNSSIFTVNNIDSNLVKEKLQKSIDELGLMPHEYSDLINSIDNIDDELKNIILEFDLDIPSVYMFSDLKNLVNKYFDIKNFHSELVNNELYDLAHEIEKELKNIYNDSYSILKNDYSDSTIFFHMKSKLNRVYDKYTNKFYYLTPKSEFSSTYIIENISEGKLSNGVLDSLKNNPEINNELKNYWLNINDRIKIAASTDKKFVDSIDLNLLRKVTNLEKMKVYSIINIDDYYKTINKIHEGISSGKDISELKLKLEKYNDDVLKAENISNFVGSLYSRYNGNAFKMIYFMVNGCESYLDNVFKRGAIKYCSVDELKNEIYRLAGNINETGISKFVDYYLNLYNKNLEFLDNLDLNNADKKFSTLSKYGINQAADGKLFEQSNISNGGNEFINSSKRNDIYKDFEPTSKEYIKLRNYLQKVLFPGMDNITAARVISLVNENGACSYVAQLHKCFLALDDPEVIFKKCFGVDLYKRDIFGRIIKDKNGKFVLNEEQFLLKLFTDINSNQDYVYRVSGNKNGKPLIHKNSEGKWEISEKYYDSFEEKLVNPQIYFDNNDNIDLYIDYIKSKCDGILDIKNKYIINNNMEYPISTNDVKKTILDSLSSGKTLSMVIGFDPDYKKLDLENKVFFNYQGADHALGGCHEVTITGITPQGDLILSTWTKKAYININELVKHNFDIIETQVTLSDNISKP